MYYTPYIRTRFIESENSCLFVFFFTLKINFKPFAASVCGNKLYSNNNYILAVARVKTGRGPTLIADAIIFKLAAMLISRRESVQYININIS